MSSLEIKGGRKLHGEVDIHGAKNSVLPLLAATFLCDGQSVLYNCPDLSDVKASLEILKGLGSNYIREGDTVIITSGESKICEIPDVLMREIRSSIVFMGAVAAKCGSVTLSLPGGCELGPRPIDLHIDALKRLGANFDINKGKITCSFPDGIKASDIHLKFPSVGATENAIFTAAMGRGTTVIYNAAREPEIADVCSFLNKAGASILGGGTDTVVINGVHALRGVEHKVMPDRIIAATCMFALGACGGKIRLKNVIFEHLQPMVNILKDSGCDVRSIDDEIFLTNSFRLSNFDTVTTQPYPGFPTDAGPLLVAMSSVTKGTGVFIENIFDSRFRYIDELKRLGADIKTVGKVAVITGVPKLHGAKVHSCDLRGGAALTVAAMAAEGTSIVTNVEYIDRGYQRIEDIFGALNADIKRCWS